MIELEQDGFQKYLARLKVIGVGGGGCNAVDFMMAAGGIPGVEWIAANTDVQSLRNNLPAKKLPLGRRLTKGLGTGGDCTIGRRAAEESAPEIEEALQGADMVFLVAALGGGTGSGAAPVVVEIARRMEILTAAVLMLPFSSEGERRAAIARESLEAIEPNADALIIIPNDRLNDTSKEEAFLTAVNRPNAVVLHAVQGISGVIHSEGFINRDFADVKRILSSRGKVWMGCGFAEGENRALRAVQQAVENPLLNDVRLEGAGILLVHIAAGSSFTLKEFREIHELFRSAARPGAEIIPGFVKEEGLQDALRVTVIAADFSSEKPLSENRKPAIGEPFESIFCVEKPSLERDVSQNVAEWGALRGEAYFEIPAYLRRKSGVG